MDYRLFLKEGRWHAYDIVVDGVSLVKNYRSQFQKIIRQSSYEELVKKLRERTLTGRRKRNHDQRQPELYSGQVCGYPPPPFPGHQYLAVAFT
jgi:hypothetical protein